MKFGRRAFMLAIAAAAAVAACSSPASNAGPGTSTSGAIPLLRVGTNFPINTLNPVTNGGNAGLIDSLSLETLLNLGPHNTLKPELATSVSHPNPVTYVYHLRPGSSSGTATR